MNEALILERLDNLSREIQSLKSSVLDELKQDLVPVINQATPRVMTFLSELEGHYSNEDLALLVKNILINVKNLNSLLDMLKAGMELKEDLGPVVRQGAPKVTSLLAELEGQADLTAIGEVVRKALANLENFGTAFDMLKAGMELKDDLGPVVKQALPKVTAFMAELDGQVDMQQMADLLRKVLANMENFSTALDMLKAGMELKDDLGPVVKQALPKINAFMAELDGEFEMEDLASLLRNFLINIRTFDRMLGMVKPGAELVDELANIARQYDMITKVVQTLNALEQRGIFKIMGRIFEAVQDFKCSDDQLNTMCSAISEVDLKTPSYVGPMEIMNEIRDPNVQETIGAAFKIMRAVGCCLRAQRIRHLHEEFPDEYHGQVEQVGQGENCI